MKSLLFILLSFLVITFLLFLISRNHESRKREQKLAQIESEIAEIKKQRDEEILKAGKNIQKIIIIDELSKIQIQQKEKEMRPYEKGKDNEPKDYFGKEERTVKEGLGN